MKIPDGALQAAEKFAEALIEEQWTELTSHFAESVQSKHSSETLKSALGWENLGPRLRQMYIDLSGEAEESVPHLDPPEQFDAFELGDDYMGNPMRNPPEGFDVGDSFGWVEIDFSPSDESGFDDCYSLYLAFIEEGGPKIIHYEIDLVSG